MLVRSRLMALKQPFWLLFVAVVVFATTCSCSSIGHMPSTKEEANDFGEFKSGQAEEKASEGSESWTGWAKEKLSEGLGLKHDSDAKETIKRASERAGDAAKTATDNAQDMASGK